MITLLNDSETCGCADGCCTIATTGAPPAASLFRSLGDTSRLLIVQHLMLGDHKVVELTEHLGLAQSTVSAHLRCLLGCGMVEVRPEGRSSYYRLTAPTELRNLLQAAEYLLAETGEAVALCQTSGSVDGDTA